MTCCVTKRHLLHETGYLKTMAPDNGGYLSKQLVQGYSRGVQDKAPGVEGRLTLGAECPKEEAIPEELGSG